MPLRYSQRANALKARRTVQRRLVREVILEPQHLRVFVQRRRVQRAAGAKNSDLRHAQCGGNVHQARVIAYYDFASC